MTIGETAFRPLGTEIIPASQTPGPGEIRATRYYNQAALRRRVERSPQRNL